MKEILSVMTEPDTLQKISQMTNQKIILKQPSRLIEYSQREIRYQVDVQAISERIISFSN